jgi:curli biogenesis system outer membrane secretion channel CsgG
LAEKLLKAKRVYVESFGNDVVSKTLQAMVVDAMRTTNRFIITENKDKADLILKGASLEKTSQELHALGSATSVATAAGSERAAVSGSSGSSSGGFAARSLGTADSQASTETINDARAAVRLVSTDGDVVWSSTQESKGAKYKGAAADVADKIVKQLLRDIEKLSRSSSPSLAK